jgi:hypothetical protein
MRQRYMKNHFMSRCERCPVSQNEKCRGETIRGFCEYIDPASPRYHPEFARILVRDDWVADPAPSNPPLARQASNALGAFGRVVGAAVTGKKVRVDSATQEARLAICRACEKFDAPNEKCSMCGCHMAGVVGKTALATEKCPIGKW